MGAKAKGPSGALRRLTKSYARFLTHYPWAVMLASTVFHVVLGVLVYLYAGDFALENPRVGFEARGNDFGRRTLAWTTLQARLSSRPKDGYEFSRRANYTRPEKPRRAKKPRVITFDGDDGRRRKRDVDDDVSDWANDFLKAFTGQPCLQMASNFTTAYGLQASFLAQVAWELPSSASLFRLETVREMCAFEEALLAQPAMRRLMALDMGQPELQKHLNNFWAFPSYAACLSPKAFNCSYLSQQDLDSVRDQVMACKPHYRTILDCVNVNGTESGLCDELPEPCQSPYVQRMFFTSFSKDFLFSSGPVHLLNLLPIFTRSAYRSHGVSSRHVPVQRFQDLERKAMQLDGKTKTFRLVGLKLGIKHKLFNAALLSDFRWGLLAGLLVVGLIWLYAFSVFYTAMVAVCLVKSVLTGFAVYRFVFGITFFPFMNLLSLVILIGIGADDCFVLNFIFNRAKKEAEKRRRKANCEKVALPNLDTDSQMGTLTKGQRSSYRAEPVAASCPVEVEEETDLLVVTAEMVEEALSHAVLSMAVTSLTTAAAFCANLVSDVTVIKCFGLFASVLVLVNFVLVVTWLPACLVVLYKTINPGLRRLSVWAGRVTTLGQLVWWLAADAFPLQRLLRLLTDSALPFLVQKLRVLWVGMLALVLVVGPILIFYRPGLSLPSVNPLQVFRDSSPMEWQANEAPLRFPFYRHNSFYPILAIVLWGFRRNEGPSHLDPDDGGDFGLEPSFRLETMAELRELDRLCRAVHTSPAVSPDSDHYPCWTSKFLAWAQDYNCANRTQRHREYSEKFCCDPESVHFVESRHLVPCLKYVSQYYSTYWDSLLFRNWPNGTSDLVGYWMEFQSTDHYSGIFHQLKSTFTKLEGNVSAVLETSPEEGFRKGFFIPRENNTAIWLELLDSLVQGTPVSVGASIGVALLVAVLSTRELVVSLAAVVSIVGVIVATVATIALLGWRVNVVESTVLILTVGLSFDFTLHYAVAYKLSPAGEPLERAVAAIRFIGLPVLLSAATTAVAGLAMLGSTTNAFYEIGAFLLIVSTTSFVVSSLCFTSLVSFVGGRGFPKPRQKVAPDPAPKGALGL